MTDGVRRSPTRPASGPPSGPAWRQPSAHTSPRRSPPRRASSPRPALVRQAITLELVALVASLIKQHPIAPDGRSARRVDRGPARRCPTSSEACVRRDCSRRSGTRGGRDRARHGHRHPMREMPVRPQPKTGTRKPLCRRARTDTCPVAVPTVRSPDPCGTLRARPGRCPNPRAGTNRARAPGTPRAKAGATAGPDQAHARRRHRRLAAPASGDD
jgi:hypothetical protein